MNGHIVCERPNTAIYKYEGYIQLGANSEKISLNNDYMMLRGMSLRNTEHVYGVVVFNGKETKVLQNSASAKYKFSSLEKLTNKSIYIIFLL
jgi:magnesium-transporting ATPase (P-type)